MAKEKKPLVDDTAELASVLRRKRQDKVLDPRKFLSTGSTLLNLGISDRIDGGFIKGGFHWLVGDSDTGKTFLTLTCLAEAARNPEFKKYRFIFDNAENGALMDIEKFFGKEVKRRWEEPSPHGASETIDELYVNLDRACKDGRPFIYILDSFDALSSLQEQKKHKERMTAISKGTEAKGEMTDGKAKRNSSGLRIIHNKIKRSGSIFTGISQTRDSLGWGFEDQTASGGRALKFYASVQLWTSPRGKLKKTVLGKDRELGIKVNIAVRKNRISGKKRDCIVPIYHSYGIDDLGSMVDYLVEEKVWSKSDQDGKKSGKVTAPQFQFVGSKERLVAHIEENDLENDLRQLVQTTWDTIEAKCVVPRKKRYQ